MAELSFGDCQTGSAQVENFEWQVLIFRMIFFLFFRIDFTLCFGDLNLEISFDSFNFGSNRLFRVPSTVLTYL